MKKAKFVLTSIAVFAIVGTALAFKAQKFIFIETTPGSGLCDKKVISRTITDNGTLTPIRLVNPGVCTTTTYTTTIVDSQ